MHFYIYCFLQKNMYLFDQISSKQLQGPIFKVLTPALFTSAYCY